MSTIILSMMMHTNLFHMPRIQQHNPLSCWPIISNLKQLLMASSKYGVNVETITNGLLQIGCECWNQIYLGTTLRNWVPGRKITMILEKLWNELHNMFVLSILKLMLIMMISSHLWDNYLDNVWEHLQIIDQGSRQI